MFCTENGPTRSEGLICAAGGFVAVIGAAVRILRRGRHGRFPPRREEQKRTAKKSRRRQGDGLDLVRGQPGQVGGELGDLLPEFIQRGIEGRRRDHTENQARQSGLLFRLLFHGHRLL